MIDFFSVDVIPTVDPGICTDTFKMKNDAAASEGTEVKNVNVESDCEDECLRVDQCWGFDFNRHDVLHLVFMGLIQ